MKTHLFTVTTNSFNEYDILSKKTQNELEYEYYKVVDQGYVEDIHEGTEIIEFLHNNRLKSLPFGRLID